MVVQRQAGALWKHKDANRQRRIGMNMMIAYRSSRRAIGAIGNQSTFCSRESVHGLGSTGKIAIQGQFINVLHSPDSRLISYAQGPMVAGEHRRPQDREGGRKSQADRRRHENNQANLWTCEALSLSLRPTRLSIERAWEGASGESPTAYGTPTAYFNTVQT